MGSLGGVLSALIPLASAVLSGAGISGDISKMLLPVISAAVGPDIEAAIGGITLSQWLSLGINLYEAEPEIATGLQKAYAGIHPVLAQFIADINAHLKTKPVKLAVESAALARLPQKIPGYAADGGVAEISNPDLKT